MSEMDLEMLIVCCTLVVLSLFLSALCYPSSRDYVYTLVVLVIDVRVSSECEHFWVDRCSHTDYYVWIMWHTTTGMMFASGCTLQRSDVMYDSLYYFVCFTSPLLDRFIVLYSVVISVKRAG